MCLIDTTTSVPKDRNWEDFIDFLATVSETIERLRDHVFMVSNEADVWAMCH